MRILLASETGDLIAPLRQGAGAQLEDIVTCPTGQRVLEELRLDVAPWLVILEQRAESFKPLQLCRDIRALPLENYCYVLVVLAEEGGDSEAFFEAGADNCIAAPLTPRRFQAHLAAAMRIMQLNMQLSQIHRCSPVAMVLLDQAGRVRRTNPAAGKLAEPDSQATPAADVMPCIQSLVRTGACGRNPHCGGCQAYAVLQDALDNGRPHQRSHVAIPPSLPTQRRRHLLISTSPLTVGHARMLLVTIEDVTRIYRSRRRLEATISELKAFNRLAIGRELQMVQLKRQVNALHAEAGRDAPYDIDFAEASLAGEGGKPAA